jgi:cell division protease FtsH
MSEDTQKQIDIEVRRFVDNGYETAKQILTDRMDDLHIIAKGLLEYETLSGDEILALLTGQAPHRPDDDNDATTGPKSPFPTAGGPIGGATPQST